MSDQPKVIAPIIPFLSVLIFFALVAAATVYVEYSDDKALAAEQIWDHIKTLSLIVTAYFFGERRAMP
ncbi:hypothetical protein [Marinobacter salicampi]|uniref:hypothetical protein n=1 Tax=Marinobacter salicampi TaxID=435907 RepID=UPI00140E1943|nr:hypothetical protein [Marinobacter salicampi]